MALGDSGTRKNLKDYNLDMLQEYGGLPPVVQLSPMRYIHRIGSPQQPLAIDYITVCFVWYFSIYLSDQSKRRRRCTRRDPSERLADFNQWIVVCHHNNCGFVDY